MWMKSTSTARKRHPGRLQPEKDYPELKNRMLLAVTEMNTAKILIICAKSWSEVAHA
jgi:hypothetical protein